MSAFTKFFSKIGHFLSKAFDVVHDVIPEAMLAQAVAVVKSAADKFIDNAERREWAVHELMTVLHVSESVARLGVELAVNILKKEAKDAIDGVVDGSK